MAEPLSFLLKAALVAGVLLLGLSACATYDPRTGQSYYDPGATMAAVGTAAFVGSVAGSYREPPRPYHRPPHHHHYNPPRPPSHRPPSHRPPSHRPSGRRPPRGHR